MSFILLGHGDLLVHPGDLQPNADDVGVPFDSTLQLYTDAGQGLMLGPDELDAWGQVFCVAAADGGARLPNLALHGGDDLWDEELRSALEHGGHVLIRPGVDGQPDPIRLCTGTPETCPPPGGTFGDVATHDCDGVLGDAGLRGGVVHWLECASITRAPATATEGGARRKRVPWDPSWVPDEADQRAIAQVNRRLVRAASDRTILNFVIGGSVFLIGDGSPDGPYSRHHPMHEYYARELQADNVVYGKLRVRRPWLENGWFDVAGVPHDRQSLVTDSIARFAPGRGIGFVELRSRRDLQPAGADDGKGQRG